MCRSGGAPLNLTTILVNLHSDVPTPDHMLLTLISIATSFSLPPTSVDIYPKAWLGVSWWYVEQSTHYIHSHFRFLLASEFLRILYHSTVVSYTWAMEWYAAILYFISWYESLGNNLFALVGFLWTSTSKTPFIFSTIASRNCSFLSHSLNSELHSTWF